MMFVCLAAAVAAAGCAEKTPTVADMANQPGATPIVNSVPPQPVRPRPVSYTHLTLPTILLV